MAVALVIVTLAGCGVPYEQPEPISVSPFIPRPPGVEDPAIAVSRPPAPTCDPRASLRPRAPLPAPGEMPPDTPMATIASRGRLIVGVNQIAYQFAYRDPDSGRLIGFDIDLAKEIARAIFGDPEAIQFKAMNVAERIKAIQSGSVDIVVHTFTINCDRLQQVAFSTEYLTVGHRVLVKRNSGYRSMDDLGGRKVCAPKGSTPMQSIQNAPSRPIPVGANDSIDCLVLLQQGQVEAVCTDDAVLAGLAEQDPTTEVVGPPFSNDPYGVAMAKDAPELVRFVNAVLERVRSDGTWAELYGRWLGKLGSTPAPPQARYLD